ncbi:MAG: winged helix-turn-helix transcriptional regulator [Clostridiales Family XIII bacterium]|jgi:deoxyribonucleoside regulator|nr:winged helix-turn-helix transcriptional regulator [Clostridiales Family XIII bacterium]
MATNKKPSKIVALIFCNISYKIINRKACKMTKDFDHYDLNFVIRVVKKYYVQGMTQDQIAKEEFISKSTVSRLLKKAVDNGLITFQFNYPIELIRNLENEFKQIFDLDVVRIAPTFAEDIDTRIKETCRIAAEDLIEILETEDTLGIGWGLTIEKLTDIITTEIVSQKKCRKVVMIEGSIAGESGSTRTGSLIRKLAEYFSAEGYLLPGPLLYDSKETADIVKTDTHLKNILDYSKAARIAVFSVRHVSHESVLYKEGAYSKEDYEKILAQGAVGDILGYSFDMNGKSVDPNIDNRVISMNLDELKKKKYRMGIAVGDLKAKSIIGALRGKYVNYLYTDSLTAKEVLRLLNITQN